MGLKYQTAGLVSNERVEARSWSGSGSVATGTHQKADGISGPSAFLPAHETKAVSVARAHEGNHQHTARQTPAEDEMREGHSRPKETRKFFPVSDIATKKPEKQKLPEVPETLLKRRKQRALSKVKQLQNAIKQRKANRTKRLEIFKRAEQYVKEYRRQERDTIRLKRVARNKGNFYVPAEPKLAVVIRIRGVNGVSPKPRKVLQLLRLRQINNATFVKLNKATVNMLRIAEPYITWGYLKIHTSLLLIATNVFEQQELLTKGCLAKRKRKKGIICVEDLIHELYTVGPNFKKANNFLWHFKLNTPRGGWRKKTNHYSEGGDFGNREDLINRLLRRMI
ncbi:hypothetical protein HPB47_025064 [Ixodes persulcatus]|uniref:Uncharacterized protein n=1 Tax=Ixodes persulcatus TaxID=34615 RepID=A0AC60Q308_IXOPE|nr:hypothetical protein HPB47_025064 [Ixodes persulcatus]